MMFLESFGFAALVIFGLISLAWCADKLFDAIGGEYGEFWGSAALFFIICFVFACILTLVRWIVMVVS